MYVNQQETTDELQKCIVEISEWMKTSALKLNEEKTEYSIFSKDKIFVHDAIKAGNNNAPVKGAVKILGVTLDSNMTTLE